MLSTILVITTLVLQIIRMVYWYFSEKKSELELPANNKLGFASYFKRFILVSFHILLFIQLIGLKILPMEHALSTQVIGFILTSVGIYMSILGRYNLGINWTHGVNYQVKKGQKLVDNGIYRLVRHPIYSGLFISYIGSQLVAESYLAFIFFLVCLYPLFSQAKKEENLMLDHFGNKYADYMRRTKRFIPYVI